MGRDTTDTPVIRRVRELVEPIASDLQLDIYDVEQRGGTMRVTLDTPAGSDSSVDLDQLAEEFLIGKANAYGAATFYDFLKPENKGKQVYVCNGTACHCAGTQEAVLDDALVLLVLASRLSVLEQLRHFVDVYKCGVAILGNGVNLLIFTSGRLTREIPPIIPDDLAVSVIPTANPLPQALVLTAIVISFSFFAFLLVLGYRAYQTLGTDDTEGMRLAEPEGEELPPLGY